MKDRTKLLIGCISVALVAAIVILISASGKKQPAPQQSATPDETVQIQTVLPTAAASAEQTALPSQPPTEAVAVPSVSDAPAPTQASGEAAVSGQTETPTKAAQTPAVPSDLEEKLSSAGTAAKDLSDSGCRQLVVVSADGSTADVSLYTYENGQWKHDEELDCSGFVGEEGTISPSYMSEQHSATPLGLYPITEAFYQNAAPETGLSTFAITGDTYWVDDPDSAYYNRRVEGTGDMDWTSAEHMADYSAYEYGFVIGYNAACEYNKGSAIFFHVGSNPTAGCVAVSREMVLAYLVRLEASLNPHILIVSV